MRRIERLVRDYRLDVGPHVTLPLRSKQVQKRVKLAIANRAWAARGMKKVLPR